MPDWIVVDDVRPWDGRYQLDLDDAPFTIREWGWIKRHTGYLPVTLTGETFTDPEMITMLAIIAMRRSGKIDVGDVQDVWDRFQDVPFGSAVTLELDTKPGGDADGPPAASSNGNEPTSGDSSKTVSASSDTSPSRTGSPTSATSVSAPQTSAS